MVFKNFIGLMMLTVFLFGCTATTRNSDVPTLIPTVPILEAGVGDVIPATYTPGPTATIPLLPTPTLTIEPHITATPSPSPLEGMSLFPTPHNETAALVATIVTEIEEDVAGTLTDLGNGWTAYQSNTYSVSFRYPTDWVEDEWDPQFLVLYTDPSLAVTYNNFMNWASMSVLIFTNNDLADLSRLGDVDVTDPLSLLDKDVTFIESAYLDVEVLEAAAVTMINSHPSAIAYYQGTYSYPAYLEYIFDLEDEMQAIQAASQMMTINRELDGMRLSFYEAYVILDDAVIAISAMTPATEATTYVPIFREIVNSIN